MITFDELFIEFFSHITTDMSPPGLSKYDGHTFKDFWMKRFYEAYHHKKPTLRNQSYTELAQLWLAGWRDYERLIASKKPTI